ncbi:type II toxin-antitoxin system VapC family toxin [Tsukamurella asaccharolytica]|uniref:type II toxin-antitoxin system VapC family toxin n=1 Tax=Tsukamurella asaccharolytica TaxID=2592067 RepID=UPI001315606E|nr:type II toxin-antitoxin system VapC family toxin [Tsukamurella asaccharolytica]
MNYLDTSALIKLLAPEFESDALTIWMARQANEGEAFGTSVIGQIELTRAAARMTDPDTTSQAQYIGEQAETIPLTVAMAKLAETIGPPHLRSLDAVHLASAMSIRDQISAFVTYDKRLSDAAEVEGLTVVSPGAE